MLARNSNLTFTLKHQTCTTTTTNQEICRIKPHLSIPVNVTGCRNRKIAAYNFCSCRVRACCPFEQPKGKGTSGGIYNPEMAEDDVGLGIGIPNWRSATGASTNVQNIGSVGSIREGYGAKVESLILRHVFS
jgi:hypothetical protein